MYLFSIYARLVIGSFLVLVTQVNTSHSNESQEKFNIMSFITFAYIARLSHLIAFHHTRVNVIVSTLYHLHLCHLDIAFLDFSHGIVFVVVLLYLYADQPQD